MGGVVVTATCISFEHVVCCEGSTLSSGGGEGDSPRADKPTLNNRITNSSSRKGRSKCMDY